ncbi:hypothetical protein UT300003_25200 [Clostridium sardiniense]
MIDTSSVESSVRDIVVDNEIAIGIADLITNVIFYLEFYSYVLFNVTIIIVIQYRVQIYKVFKNIFIIQ